MKRTYQPSKIRRARTHGFLVRMKTRGGRAVINARRAKGRWLRVYSCTCASRFCRRAVLVKSQRAAIEI